MQKAVDEKKHIELERIFGAPVARVWKAITSKDDMKKWYIDIAEFKPQTGFEFQWWGGSEDKKFLHLCRITEAVPDKRLAYTWRYDGYEGSSLVTFELFAEGKKTRLKLTHVGIDTFPQDDPHFDRKNFVDGWNQLIDKSLREFLERA